MIDKEVVDLFGASDSLNVSQIVEYLNMLSKYISPLLGKGPLTKKKPVESDNIFDHYPRSLDQVFSGLSVYFTDLVNWRSPRTHFNITPPVCNPAIAAAALAHVMNQTLVSDMGSGNLSQLELDIVKCFGELAGWDSNSPSGVFTFGGTGTNIYGVKIGINKADRHTSERGVHNVVTVDSDQCHSSHRTIADWLGVGINNNIQIRADESGRLRATDIISTLDALIKQSKVIGCVTLSGGTTYDWSIDPIKEVKEGITELVARHKLQYTPHIHTDAVIGWVYLFFKNYNFDANPLRISERTLTKVRQARDRIIELRYADSFGIDFHKTGFCPITSMLRNKYDWKVLGKGTEHAHHQAFQLGSYSPGKYTLETSRSTVGPVTTYVTLAALGISGYQKIIAGLVEGAEDMRMRIESSEGFYNCNPYALGWCTMFLVRDNNSKITMEDLLTHAPEHITKKSNQLQKEFQKYLRSLCSENGGWHISCSNDYKKSASGISISTLKLYPMSPLLQIGDNRNLMDWLEQRREEFLGRKNA